jgi:hypothetical protein
MQDKVRREIVETFGEQVKELVKGLIERMMREERDLYLEEHPTKGNGHYTRDLLTLVGPLKDLKVPVSGKETSTRGFYRIVLALRSSFPKRYWGCMPRE